MVSSHEMAKRESVMNKFKVVSMFVSAASLVGACGTAAKDEVSQKLDEKSNPAAGSTAALLADNSVLSESISASVNESVQDASSDGAASAAQASLSLAEAQTSNKVELFRACKIDESTPSKAVVNITRTISRDKVLSRGIRNNSFSVKDNDELKRVWSKADTAVVCDAEGKHAAINFANMGGMKLEESFTSNRVRSNKVTSVKTGESIGVERNISAKGTRLVDWSAAWVEGDNIKLLSTVKSSSERTLTMKNKKGESLSFVSSVKTDDAAPLQIEAVRNAKSKDLVSRTIVSGKRLSSTKDGGRIETVFNNLKYTPDAECYPVSGSISGAVFAKDAAAASLNYVISFSGDAKSILFTKPDGTTSTVDYVAESCAMEAEKAQATGVVEKSSAAGVSAN
jgi:hypothetical protein